MPEKMSPPHRMTISEPDLARLYERCSNIGRWGRDDERGTLNLITPIKRAEAARLVTEGRTVPLGRELRTSPSNANRSPAIHRMLYAGHVPWMCMDTIEVAPHGYSVTHLDSLAHVFLDGWVWNGREAADVVTRDGLRFASIRAFSEGIFTRGVLLDVAAARGVAWLPDTDDVTPSDLDHAEELAGVHVRPGDAIVVRTGLAAREMILGEEDPTRRAGLTPDCLAWIKDRDVAVYSGDCIERRPSPYPAYPLPVHMIGMVAMGLAFLDNLALEALRDTCGELQRSTFLLTCAPVVLDGATGSAVNPLAVF